MTATKQFLVLSPNLGCPRLILKDQLITGTPGKGRSISVLIASNYWPDGCLDEEVFQNRFLLRPSGSHAPGLELCPVGPPREIVDWDCPGEFDDAEDTQRCLSRELHYGALGSDTRYWALELFLKDPKALEKTMADRMRLLFDMIWSLPGNNAMATNFHSVQVMKNADETLRFVHVADLHLARRNDEILADVLQCKHERTAGEIKVSYVNFNEHFRKFVRHANTLADKNELDFVVVTGDIVDFANPGWKDESCAAQNNWKTFVNIVTGAENRPEGEGLKVAMFTSLGNHDWRLHPYNPCRQGGAMFGLHRDEIKDCAYKGFDCSTLNPNDPRRREAEKVSSEMYQRMNMIGVGDKVRVFLAPWLAKTVTRWVSLAILPLGIRGGSATGLPPIISTVISLLAAGLAWWGLRSLTPKAVNMLVDNPLHAGPSAVHFYLKHVNPYFDYAFRWGPHWFIVMDTGADVFTGKLLDGKVVSDLRKMSLEDNIFGGSPDSRAFDVDHTHCDWSQIVWLERVLSAASKHSPDGRKFVFLHAPPINTDKSNQYVADHLAESRRSDPKWVPKEECNLTYGSINHYLSQFFYLCLGRQEGDPDFSNPHGVVDLVLSGHAHRNIEFRIKLSPDREIRIYTDGYSTGLTEMMHHVRGAGSTAEWWKSHRPVIAQTAACGPKGDEDVEPPYFRRVTINAAREVQEFQVVHL